MLNNTCRQTISFKQGGATAPSPKHMQKQRTRLQRRISAYKDRSMDAYIDTLTDWLFKHLNILGPPPTYKSIRMYVYANVYIYICILI